MVSMSNYRCLLRSFDGIVRYISFNPVDSEVKGYSLSVKPQRSKVRTAINNLCLLPGRFTRGDIERIKEIICEESPTHVYFDSTIFGELAQWVKSNFPNVKTICYIHNIELDFELSRLKSGGFLYLPSLWSVIFNERKCIENSDVIISLHQQDSLRCKQLYGKESQISIPVAVSDPKVYHGTDYINKKNLTLGFLGSAFYANIKAAYFIKEIALALPDHNFLVCGRGFSDYESKLSCSNLQVLGSVDSISNFYKKVDVFISPIFCGAGMKVKIAEAMSYNKPIIASDFSLIGYDKCYDAKGLFVANTKCEYMKIIQDISENGCEVSTYCDYKREFSLTSNISKFTQVVN